MDTQSFFDSVLYRTEQARRAACFKLGHRMEPWRKVDTGHGFGPEDHSQGIEVAECLRCSRLMGRIVHNPFHVDVTVPLGTARQQATGSVDVDAHRGITYS